MLLFWRSGIIYRLLKGSGFSHSADYLPLEIPPEEKLSKLNRWMLRPEQCFPPKAAVATHDQAEEGKKTTHKQLNKKKKKREKRKGGKMCPGRCSVTT